MNNPPPHKRRRRRSSSDDDDDDDNDKPFVYTGQAESEISKDVTHIAFDPNVCEIEDWAFTRSMSLQNIIIPETIDAIGVEAFSGCESLSDVQLCMGLKVIGRSSFLGCRALTDLQIPLGVETIGAGAFEECDSLLTVSIPSSMEAIGDDAFQDCYSLTSVSFGEGLRRLGRRAFCRCEALVEIELPRGLKEVPFCAFSGCDALKTASVPNTVETIDTSAFDSCRGLIEVHLGEGLVSIGARAFARCISLSAVALPSTIEMIASHAFHGCLGLLGVEIPVGTRVSIAAECFDGCVSLINISLPDTAETVSDVAFSDCKLLGELLETAELKPGEEEIDGIACLQERFNDLPIHRASYHASVTTVETLSTALNSNSLEEGDIQDSFGMTPLHIVATSAQLRGDIFELLLNHYPLEVLWRKDRNRTTATGYLLTHMSNKAVPLIQLTLQRLIDVTMSRWGLSRWRTELEGRTSSIPQDIGTGTRNAHIHRVYKYLDYCMKIEVTSLIEQALWKMRMSVETKAESENDQSYRDDCRLQCGSEIVIENVIQHLWNDETESDAALSVYPLIGRSENS